MFKVEIRYTDYRTGFIGNHRYSSSSYQLAEVLDFIHSICDCIPSSASVDCIHVYDDGDEEDVF